MTISPQTKLNAPIARQIKFSFIVKGTVLVATPPNYTSAIYPKKIIAIINRNRPLLKNPARTLYASAPSFREFTALNIVIKTNV